MSGQLSDSDLWYGNHTTSTSDPISEDSSSVDKSSLFTTFYVIIGFFALIIAIIIIVYIYIIIKRYYNDKTVNAENREDREDRHRLQSVPKARLTEIDIFKTNKLNETTNESKTNTITKMRNDLLEDMDSQSVSTPKTKSLEIMDTNNDSNKDQMGTNEVIEEK